MDGTDSVDSVAFSAVVEAGTADAAVVVMPEAFPDALISAEEKGGDDRYVGD